MTAGRSDSSTFTITPMLVGVFPSIDRSFFLPGRDPGVKMRAPCISWLIRGDHGETIVVDTGPSAGDAPAAHLHQKLEVNPEHGLERAVRRAGIEPAEVTTVIFSHLHFDHCYHGEVFPRARFLVQQAELRYAVAPIPWHRSHFEVGLPGIQPPWFPVFDRIDAVDGDTAVLPGVSFVALPGHTPGSAGVTVRTKRGIHLLAGDTVSVVENWEGGGGQRHIAPGAYDVIETFRSFEKMERIADVVLASHDFRMLDAARYPA